MQTDSRPRNHNRGGFTLVELLVVIGIIALLISILLPSLNKARQQANLVKCQANLKTIGQLVATYAAENMGRMPMCADQVRFTNFADTLTLQAQKPKRYASAPYPGQPAGSELFMPDRTGEIFHDVDTPSEDWFEHSNAYVGNIRAMGAINVFDRFTGNNQGWHQRQASGIKRSAEVMLIWCGACEINNGKNYGVYHAYPNALDNYQMYGNSGDHGLMYPTPIDSNYSTDWYDNPISLGGSIGGTVAASSKASGTVTKSYLAAANRDYTNIGQFSGIGGFDTNYMRFRHLNNSAANFLFVDGHVSSRRLGEVRARDVCLNAQ